MPTNILASLKAWAALIGGIVTAVLATVPPHTQVWQILTYVSAVATAIATYAVPNLDPKGKRQAESVQPPADGIADEPRTLVRALPRTDPRLGRHVEHDPRSRAFPAPATAPIVSKTWRHYGPVLDQGQVGSCTGNAMAQALNTHPLHRSRTPYLTEADALDLYEHATSLDDVPGTYPPDDTGSSGLSVAKAAQQQGYITGYTHAFGLDHALAALMNGPLIVGSNWTQGMFTPDARGFVHPTGAVAGGHEYLLLGVNTDRGYATFLNSWGVGWGKRGRFYMRLDDFGSLLANGGDATQPVPVS